MKKYYVLISVFLYIYILMLPAGALAKDPATPEFTLQQAVEKAKANSKALKLANYDIDRGLLVRDNAADKVEYTPVGPTTDPAAKVFTGLVQADLAWQMAKRSLRAQEDTVEMKAYQAYNGLLQAQEKVRVAEAQLKDAEWQHRMAVVSHRVGVLNKTGLIQAEAGLTSARAGLEAAKSSLNDAYQSFNQLVGLWPEDRPVLTERPEFEVIEINSLDAEVNRVLAESPSIWLAQRKIDLAKITLDLYDLTDNTQVDPYDAKEIDVEKADVSAADSKEQMRKLVRTLYYTVRQLEEQYAGAQENLELAEETLRVTRVKFDVGMATQKEVLAAEAALAKAEQSLLDLSCQHEVLVLAFKKPWAYAASPSSGSAGGTSSSGQSI